MRHQKVINPAYLRMLLRLSIVVLRSWPSQQVFATKFGKNKAFARKIAACGIRNTFAIAMATARAANEGYTDMVLYAWAPHDTTCRPIIASLVLMLTQKYSPIYLPISSVSRPATQTDIKQTECIQRTPKQATRQTPTNME